MRISARGKYALQAILEMSKAPPGAVLKVADIAAGPRIPPEYLVQVLILLKTAGIVESVRGKTGGYRLARRRSQITVADVIEAVEGGIHPVAGLGWTLLDILNRADQAARSVLAATTFEDLCKAELERRETVTYAI